MSDNETKDPLGNALREHFAAELDGYVGRAAERFNRTIGPADAAPLQARSARSLQLWWSAPILAAAAAIAMVVGPHIQLRQTPPAVVRGPATIAPSTDPTEAQPQYASFEPQDLQGSLTWSTHDDGQVWFDDQTTARRMRTRQLQTIQWTDPADSSRIEITVPREEVVLVSSPKF